MVLLQGRFPSTIRARGVEYVRVKAQYFSFFGSQLKKCVRKWKRKGLLKADIGQIQHFIHQHSTATCERGEGFQLLYIFCGCFCG